MQRKCGIIHIYTGKGKGFSHVYTGPGGGKTTAVLGVALRSLGHGNKVIIIQFMKGRRDIGEYKIKEKLGKNYEIYQFGRKEFVNYKNPSLIDKLLAKKGLEFAAQSLKKKPDLLILDEINLAARIGLVKPQEVLKVLKNIPTKTTVYMTGRYAPAEFIKRADIVTEVRDLKRPKKGVPLRKGIEY